MVVIGLTGKKGSGKSTVAEYLVKQYDFIEYSIARPLKEIARILCGFSNKQLYGALQDKETVDEKLGISPREFLQVFGTEICRDSLKRHFPSLKINKTIWVHLLDEFLSKNRGKNIVISDVRFLDEAKEIEKHNGIILKITRPSLSETDNHASENQSFNVYKTIENNSSIGNLLKQVKTTINLYSTY